ncbi:unnamed protein product [Rangifer tarandus platyrhynchus]|uniref:Uncharacterized protein n=2 Tax=Rangifer tarandus platyrhynchus TaxID=3082113 RepID=A0ABN8YJ44_RANTA|nr:unnamed protein product [Rangifer tarandus platyrhynchus]CAI9699203.1 unnamed protein product [Rangifer tarandus platyrhynchus]
MEPSAGHNQVLKSIAPGRTGRCLPGRSSVGPSLEDQRRFWELPGRPARQLGGCRGRSQLMLPSRWPVPVQRAPAEVVVAQSGTDTALNLTFLDQPRVNSHL